MAKQGEKYRVVKPKLHCTRIGQPKTDRYYSNINGVIVEDIFDDIITASDNVPYPRGASQDYRHLDWIKEHPERFKLITSNKE